MSANNIVLESMSEEDVNSLMNSMSAKLHKMAASSNSVCIYRISKKYRKINEEAYTPRLVSIGPLHHGKSQLQGMESYKWRCLQSFIVRARKTMGDLVKFASKEEASTRGCYEGTVQYSPKAFSEMILLDGVFIVELFLKNMFNQMRDSNDVILENNWMKHDILHDLLLLENQLPISFISGLFRYIEGSLVHQTSFLQLVGEYFKNVGNTSRQQLTEKCGRARHFVEFLIYLHEPNLPENKGIASRSGKFEYTRSASELQEAGVKFRLSTSSCLFDVSFTVVDGVIQIPQLMVNDSSETFFRNLIAFEQCGHYSKNITSYVIFMDSLINTSSDVALLVKNGIIDNLLGENQQVADLFNSIYKEVVPDQRDFYFAKTCGDLDKYSKDYLHVWKSRLFRWKVILRRDYFNNLWSFLSVIAALILLALTIVQTKNYGDINWRIGVVVVLAVTCLRYVIGDECM